MLRQLLTVLLKGNAGQAYNAANESTYCSIAEMVEKITTQGRIKVRYEIEDEIYAFIRRLALCRRHRRNFQKRETVVGNGAGIYRSNQIEVRKLS